MATYKIKKYAIALVLILLGAGLLGMAPILIVKTIGLVLLAIGLVVGFVTKS